MRWRFLDSVPGAGPELMAIDAALADRARTSGEAVLRLYQWSAPTLSFGAHERTKGRFDPATLAAHGVAAVRRPTGGRVLLHDAEFTYSVTAPASADESIGASVRRINVLLLDALRRLGVRAEEAPRPPERPLLPGRDACFSQASAGEIVVDGRKLVGSAQRRDVGVLLQHGSILLTDEQARILELAGEPMIPPAPAAALDAILGRRVTREEVRAAFQEALRSHEETGPDLPHEEARAMAEPFVGHFASPEWTWRR